MTLRISWACWRRPAYRSGGEALALASSGAGEAGGMVRKQQGKKFWSGRAVDEPVLSMSTGKLSLLLVAPAAPAWGHVPLP